MQQELQDRWRPGRAALIVIVVCAWFGAELKEWPFASFWLRLPVWLAFMAAVWALISLAVAQVRAKSQPFDHTLILRPEGISLLDNLRRKEYEYDWKDFERVAIESEYFIIRRKGSDAGEQYLISRDKLSEEEERFLGERMVEL